jgi:hypothetical protein
VLEQLSPDPAANLGRDLFVDLVHHPSPLVRNVRALAELAALCNAE